MGPGSQELNLQARGLSSHATEPGEAEDGKPLPLLSGAVPFGPSGPSRGSRPGPTQAPPLGTCPMSSYLRSQLPATEDGWLLLAEDRLLSCYSHGCMISFPPSLKASDAKKGLWKGLGVRVAGGCLRLGPRNVGGVCQFGPSPAPVPGMPKRVVVQPVSLPFCSSRKCMPCPLPGSWALLNYNSQQPPIQPPCLPPGLTLSERGILGEREAAALVCRRNRPNSAPSERGTLCLGCETAF